MAWYDSSSYLEVRFFVKERKCFNARERRKERTTNDKSVSGSKKIIYKNMERPVDTLIVNYFANPLFTTGSLFFFARARPFLNRANGTRLQLIVPNFHFESRPFISRD